MATSTRPKSSTGEPGCSGGDNNTQADRLCQCTFISDPNGLASARSRSIDGKGTRSYGSIGDPPTLPQLNYNLCDHTTKLFIVGGLLVIESSVLPISMFYGFWFGTSLRHGILFAIITSFYGLVTGIEFGLRSWRLVQKSDMYRPMGTASRWCFDATHATLGVGYTIVTALLIGASIPTEPIVPALALPVPFLLVQVSLQLVWTGYMDIMKKHAPLRISSVGKGDRVVPAVYTIVEDIVAVDGGAGKEYRERLRERYRVSRRFRTLLRNLNWFWGLGGLLVGTGTIAVIWTVPQEVAYGVGWTTPLIFVSVWVVITLHWVHRSLRREKLEGSGEHRALEMASRPSPG